MQDARYSVPQGLGANQAPSLQPCSRPGWPGGRVVVGATLKRGSVGQVAAHIGQLQGPPGMFQGEQIPSKSEKASETTESGHNPG
jgi:hypothetical protein